MPFTDVVVCKVCDSLIEDRPPHPKSPKTCDACNDLFDPREDRKDYASSPRQAITYAAGGMVSRAKNRGKYKVDITTDDVLGVWPQDGKCPILGTTLRRNVGRADQRNDSAQLDRIDSSKGYIPGNIQVISGLANRMKNNATKEELRKFAEWIMENEMCKNCKCEVCKCND